MIYPVGSQIEFWPEYGDESEEDYQEGPYTVRASNEHFLVCTKPAPAHNTCWYSAIDFKRQIRGTENLIGPGAETDEDCTQMLQRLTHGESEISSRNWVKLRIKATFPSPFDSLRKDWMAEGKVTWTWLTSSKLLNLREGTADVCDAYALIEFPDGHSILQAYVHSRQMWVSAGTGYAVSELHRQVKSLQTDLLIAQEENRLLKHQLREQCMHCGQGPDSCHELMGAAPCYADPTQSEHVCNRQTMKLIPAQIEMRFGWEQVQCEVCGKVEGKPIGECYRADRNYR